MNNPNLFCSGSGSDWGSGCGSGWGSGWVVGTALVCMYIVYRGRR